MCLSIPARVDRIDGHMAVCTVGESSYEASLEMLDMSEIQIGDYVLIHTGFALQKLDEEEALETLKTFEEFRNLNKDLDIEEQQHNTRIT
ncbi:MAG: HypC/HybG/HupF family hydrogenase formation chaperone [Bacteroidales bacterium]|nr:HypC/HybG/HupF family hydrogenase formation chaperone [Bacteroidales bacterium]